MFLAMSVLLRFQLKIITHHYALDLKLVMIEEENGVGGEKCLLSNLKICW